MIWIVVGVALALMGIGLALGWWVRGAYVRGYMRRRMRRPRIPTCSVPGCHRPLAQWGPGEGGIWVRCAEHLQDGTP